MKIVMAMALPIMLAVASSASDASVPPVDTDAVRSAVDHGLAALVKLQMDDGSYGDSAGITALAGMALLSAGHTPTRGTYARNVDRAIRSVLAHQDRASGYLGGDGGRMYGHGFATLFLSECYGMASSGPLRHALEAAVDLIHRSQNSEGGWRYEPFPIDADISITICQIMALRAAWNVGIGGRESVEASAHAIDYVRRCARGDGTFAYTDGDGPQDGTEIPRSSAAAMSLIGAGITDPADETLGPALRFIRRHVAAHLRGTQYLWYGQYYAAQVLFHSPEHDDWEQYWAQAAPQILARQSSDGSWPGVEGPGPAYGTAMALIILQIPNQYLPIFQR